MGSSCVGSWDWLGCNGRVVASVLYVLVFGVFGHGVGVCWGGSCAVCVVFPCVSVGVVVLTLWRRWRGWLLRLRMG